MTDSDLAAGVAALKAYVQQIDGWEADFVSAQAYSDGASIVITTYDGAGVVGNPAPGQLDLISAECASKLYASIQSAGYGSKVTPDQCAQASQAVIAAVLSERAGQA